MSRWYKDKRPPRLAGVRPQNVTAGADSVSLGSERLGMTTTHEQGAALVIALLVTLAITMAIVALLYLTHNDVLISSNMAVQNAAMEATDVALNTANTQLQQLTTWPEILYTANNQALSPWYAPLPTNSNTGVPLRPTAPSGSFWQNCVSNNQCASVPVNYGSYTFTVEYLIQPAGSLATQVPGNEQNQSGTGQNIHSIRYYVAYVHAANTNGGGLGVTVQAILRKVQ